MTTTQLAFSAYSDDNITLEIIEDGTTVFGDEFGSDYKKFDINGDFKIIFTHGDVDGHGGWYAAVGDFDEDRTVLNKYAITLAQNADTPYAPILCLTYEGSVVVEGIYGGVKTKVVDVLMKAGGFDDRKDAEDLFEALKKADLLK